MTYRIKIEDHKEIIFSANKAILPSNEIRSAEWEINAWLQHYDAEIVYDELEQPKYLDFRDEKHYIWFVLSVN
jgi:hypothetical protein